MFLRVSDGALAFVNDNGKFALPEGSVRVGRTRFGAPLDPASELVEIAAMDLGQGSTLRHLRHLATYDVIARDYLVYDAPGAEPLCALAATVAGALDHLAGATARTPGQDMSEQPASPSRPGGSL